MVFSRDYYQSPSQQVLVRICFSNSVSRGRPPRIIYKTPRKMSEKIRRNLVKKTPQITIEKIPRGTSEEIRRITGTTRNFNEEF